LRRDPESPTNKFYQFVYCPEPSHGWTAEQAGPGGNIPLWHQKGANFAFMDGHAKWMARDRVINTSREAMIMWGHINE
jgi:prepilin-type processing-associated H-X9-DG protein